jgi:AraC-like DNA-binding protein
MVSQLERTSSYASGALSVYETIKRCGVDPQEILSELGLDLTEFSVSGNRIETETFCTCMQLAYERCAEPCFGLLASDFIHPTSYHALGLALLSSSTLRSYLKRWERYYSLITTHATMTVHEDDDGARLQYRFFGPADRYPGAARMMREANLALVIKYIRFMYQLDYQPAKVEMMHESAPGKEAIYRSYLGENLVFEAERNAIWLDISELDRPLPAANAELARQNDQVIVQFLAKMDRANVPAQVHAKLIEMLPSGDCSKTRVASALFMSVRTLHNRLAEAGTNYQQLLDQTRRELAEQYMKQSDISVIEWAH